MYVTCVVTLFIRSQTWIDIERQSMQKLVRLDVMSVV